MSSFGDDVTSTSCLLPVAGRQVKYRWPARFRGRTQFLREWEVRSTNVRLQFETPFIFL